MTFKGFLVESTTGRLGAEIPAADGSWTDCVNDATDGSLKVPTPWLIKQPRWQWSPWSGSVLVCHEHEGRLHPIVAGPILAPPKGDRLFVELPYGGFWSFLDQRIVTDADYKPGDLIPRAKGENDQEAPPGDTSRVVASTLAFRGPSLGAIAWRLVQKALDRPMGSLPVVHGSPDEQSGRERTYPGHNLSNNSVGKRLREITEVINGPDIAFRPRLVGDDRMEWVMVHGTEGLPEIEQGRHLVWDLTAPRADVVLEQVTAEHDRVSRVYATGAGEGKGLLARIHDNPPQDRMPWREAVVSDSQVDNPALLDSAAKGRLSQPAMVQITAKMPAGGTSPLHTWNAGDAVQVIMPAGFAQIPGGTYRARIISRSGSLSSSMVSVELQPEDFVW